jgi:hypothetical protein
MNSTVFDTRCYIPSFYKILFKMSILLHKISGKKWAVGEGGAELTRSIAGCGSSAEVVSYRCLA